MNATDRAGVEAIETVFETPVIYDVAVTARRIELVERRLATPLVKRYPIDDVFAAWAQWDTAWVAEDGGMIVGFAAAKFVPWHARLVLWHLYVARAHRRSGIGRALLAEVETYGRSLGAKRVWLETTSVNLPGITAYARLGYSLVGVDTTVYDTLPYADEAAVYLAKTL